MPRRRQHIENLKSNLLSLLSGTYSHRELSSVVFLCHSMAVTFLEGKAASGTINKEFIRLSLHDAAYDCIADLFRRDDDGVLIALVSYFSAFTVHRLDDQEVLSHLRRLTFTKVNDGIVRLYHDGDPALSKIIRNIRLAVRSLGNFREVDRFGELYLAPTMCDLLEHLPKLDEQQIEHLLDPDVQGIENVLEIVGALARNLRDQDVYARMVSITHLALTVRSLYSRKAMLSSSFVDSPESAAEQTVRETMLAALRRIKSKFVSSYVAKGKLSDEMYETYFAVIKDRLEYMLQTGSIDGQSLFTCLQKYRPELSVDTYKALHRSRLEYLFKLSCDEVAKEIGR